MIRHAVGQIETTEPAIRQVQMNLLAQSPFRSDAEAIPYQQHPDQQIRIDGWATGVAVKVREMGADTAQINKPNNRPQ